MGRVFEALEVVTERKLWLEMLAFKALLQVVDNGIPTAFVFEIYKKSDALRSVDFKGSRSVKPAL